MDWRPIETAPKDGSQVLLFWPMYKYQFEVGRYIDSQHIENGVEISHVKCWSRNLGGWGDKDHAPTHWIPLEPPAK